MAHPAVIQVAAGQDVDASALTAFVKARIGSVKTPKTILVRDDLPRSKVGKILKADIRRDLIAADRLRPGSTPEPAQPAGRDR